MKGSFTLARLGKHLPILQDRTRESTKAQCECCCCPWSGGVASAKRGHRQDWHFLQGGGRPLVCAVTAVVLSAGPSDAGGINHANPE